MLIKFSLRDFYYPLEQLNWVKNHVILIIRVDMGRNKWRYGFLKLTNDDTKTNSKDKTTAVFQLQLAEVLVLSRTKVC